jgi:hypothetical protein
MLIIQSTVPDIITQQQRDGVHRTTSRNRGNHVVCLLLTLILSYQVAFRISIKFYGRWCQQIKQDIKLNGRLLDGWLFTIIKKKFLCAIDAPC